MRSHNWHISLWLSRASITSASRSKSTRMFLLLPMRGGVRCCCVGVVVCTHGGVGVVYWCLLLRAEKERNGKFNDDKLSGLL